MLSVEIYILAKTFIKIYPLGTMNIYREFILNCFFLWREAAS